MLKRLHISNFALIDEMDVGFPGKLTVITGETGAGKSIFLEALALALGKRADLASLKNKSKKCIVEAEFDVRELDLVGFFEENDLDADNTITLRREISSEGKSRSFLNDSVVSLAALKSLSEKLIDIHSQHQTLLLNQANFQLELVDAFAGTLKQFSEYKHEFQKLSKAQNHLVELLEKETQARKELDYYQFLFNELEETEIKTGIIQELEEESSTLENAEAIRTALYLGSETINGGDTNVLSAIAIVKQQLNGILKYNKSYAQLAERINSTYIELKEAAVDMETSASEVAVDNNKLEQVNSQLDKLNRLLKKHNVKTEKELLQIKSEIEGKLLLFNSIESDITSVRKKINTLVARSTSIAKELSSNRAKAIPDIEQKVKAMLTDLSMENANFKIELSKNEELSSSGIDQVKYVFSANKGSALSELHKVASGGELSRLMLSLKALLATKKQLPTIIFDEIDTGVSGDVADKIGNILLKMGKNMQVVTITHLPQMASKGQHHLFVYKKDNEDNTVSYIKELNKEERVTEIAKMLSTSNPTVSALKNAKELLSA